MSHLLVVDFDFFFENPLEARNGKVAEYGLYDWGHSENALYLSNMIWSTRASAFLRHGLPLPGVTAPEAGWEGFWDRFTFAENATFTFADSNMHAGEMRPTGPLRHGWSKSFDSIVLFDAHHDSGYNVASLQEWNERGRYSCEDWMLYHQILGCQDLTVRYPQWKPNGLNEPLPEDVLTRQMIDDGAALDTVFDAVFVCRSGAWVPAWEDPKFLDFVNACPLDGEQIDDEQLDRGFTIEDAKAMAEQWNQAEAHFQQAAAREAAGQPDSPATAP